MPDSQPPPGGPLNPEFRDAIDQLAKQARDEDRRAEDEAKRRLARRPLEKFVRVGLMLIALQALLFAYLYNRKPNAVTKKVVVTKPLFSDNSCNALVYRTYWKIIAYLKDEGHPPESFDQMIGKYLDKLPTDPATGKPLVYTTDGQRFDVRCPGIAATR